MRHEVLIAVMGIAAATWTGTLYGQGTEKSDPLKGKYSYDDFDRPAKCASCHETFARQWEQSMMANAYVHHWDEIEYFDLAEKHASLNPDLRGVVDGCNGCHTPIAFMAGDVPPPRPAEKSRANESVSCEVCHTITGFRGDTPFNYNYTVEPGRTKYGNREGVESPAHLTVKSEFIRSAEFCGICHNEKNPFGVWVKSTQLEWKEGPYAAQNVPCQRCHMPSAPAKSAKMAFEHPDVAQHLFHGAHVFSKINGAIEIVMNPGERETEPGYPMVITVALFNGKCGHKVPTGSVEDRIMWLHVEAKDAEGNIHHLPVDAKGFAGEEYTIASDATAYQDLKYVMGLGADYAGLPREAVPAGDRIFRMPYFDPEGRMTICQWNTAALGTDYRIGPRETKLETYTWNLPDDLPEGMVTVRADLYYRKLVKPVGDFLGVPEEETETILINSAETTFEIFY